MQWVWARLTSGVINNCISEQINEKILLFIFKTLNHFKRDTILQYKKKTIRLKRVKQILNGIFRYIYIFFYIKKK